MTLLRKTFSIISCCFLITTTAPAWANACSISLLPDHDFDEYVTGTALDLLTTSDFNITCDVTIAPLNYLLSLSTGNSGQYGTRHLQKGGDTALYNLYIDPARVIIFGDGTNSTQQLPGVFAATGNDQTNTHTIYGKVPGGQTLVPGHYEDLITLTLDVSGL